MFGIPNEVISIAGGAVTSFLFQYWKESRQEKAEQFQRMMDAIKANNDSHDLAKARSNDATGNWARKTIALFSLCAVVLLPVIVSFFGKSTFVEVNVEQPSSFFNLIPATVRTYFVEIPGALLTPEIRCSLLYVCGYYLGNEIKANK